jgi:hypothetical protein
MRMSERRSDEERGSQSSGKAAGAGAAARAKTTKAAPGGHGPKSVRIAFLSIAIMLLIVFGVMPRAAPLAEPAAWTFRIAISLLAGLAAGALTGTIGLKNPIVRASGGAALSVFLLVTSTHMSSERINAAVTVAPPALKTPPASPTFDAKEFQRNIQGWGQLLVATRGSKGGFRCARFGDRPEQPWTTAQVLNAYLVRPGALSPSDVNVVISGFHYLNATRLSSGGWPLWEAGKVAITEIAAWSALARMRALEVPGIFRDRQREQLIKDLRRDLTFIAGRQVANGAWAPVAVNSAENVCTYSTVMSLWALLEASSSKALGDSTNFEAQERRAINWLLDGYSDALGGWVPRPPVRHGKKYLGLTAQTLITLLRAKEDPAFAYLRQSEHLRRAVAAFVNDPSLQSRDAADNETVDGEDAVMKDAGFSIEGSTFLWVPWTMALLARIARDPDVSAELKVKATTIFARVAELSTKIEFENQGTYQVAEYTICGSDAARLMGGDGSSR